MRVEGALGVALMDLRSGKCLGSQASAALDVEGAAAANVEVVRAKQALRDQLGLPDEIEDILISLRTQDHLLRPSAVNENLFFYYMLEGSGNLPLARMTLRRIDAALETVLDDLPLPDATAERPAGAPRQAPPAGFDFGGFDFDGLSLDSSQEPVASGDSSPVEGDFILELGMTGLGM